jgi:transposase
MIGSTRSVRVWAYASPADLRRGYDGLSCLVREGLGHDPLSGNCYLFVNRRRTRAKVLVWDGTGLCIYQKRLEEGRFARLWRECQDCVELTVSELALFLEGSKFVGRYALSPERHVLGPYRKRPARRPES